MGINGAFLSCTPSQWSDPLPGTSEEDRTVDRIEKYWCVQASSIMLGGQRVFCLSDPFPNGCWISNTLKMMSASNWASVIKY